MLLPFLPFFLPCITDPTSTPHNTQARLQNPGSEFKSTWQVLQQTLRHEGVTGLYRGLGTVVGIGTPAFVLYLATYENAKRTLCAVPALEQYQFVGHFVAGMTAETVRCVRVGGLRCERAVHVMMIDRPSEACATSHHPHARMLRLFKPQPTAVPDSCLVYVPVDVIKERLQVQRRLLSGKEISGALPMYSGTWHAMRTIMATEGLRGVYRVRG